MKGDDPWPRMLGWLDEAEQKYGRDGWRLCLANCDDGGRLAARMVSLRGIDPDAEQLFVYTSYGARKGVENSAERAVALCFYWSELGRQLRVEGIMTRACYDNSERYFRSRARSHQAAVLVSRQGRPLATRAELESAHAQTMATTGVLSCPEDWGGLGISPNFVEFWRSGPHRLHHREVHKRSACGRWQLERLQP